MASLMDELVDVLDQEELKYQELITLSQEKRQVIIDANISRLEQITDAEQLITDVLHSLEIKRVNVLKDMATVLGQKAEDLNIEKMIQILEKQPAEQQRLLESKNRLHTTLEEMKKWNNQNQQLLAQAMELVEFDLTLFRSLRQAPETANYNSSAYNTGSLLGSGGFDAKQ